MKNRFLVFFTLLFLSLSSCGCVVLLATAAGGAGTAAWLSGKLSDELNAPFNKSVKAAESALRSLRLKIEKETVKEEVAQIISKYKDGKTVWIDVRRVSDASSRIEVRVGASGDMDASRKILERIKSYL